MPFHDCAVCIEGDSVNDLAHHFVQLWNNAKLEKYGSRKKGLPPITTSSKPSVLQRMLSKITKNKHVAVQGSTLSQIPGMAASNGAYPSPKKLEIEDMKEQQFGIGQSTGINRIQENQYSRGNNLGVHQQEDDKFDEGLDEIISKNANFSQFNTMNNNQKGPNRLSTLNRKYFGKFKNIFQMMKLKKNKVKNGNAIKGTEALPPKSVVSTPKSGKRLGGLQDQSDNEDEVDEIKSDNI